MLFLFIHDFTVGDIVLMFIPKDDVTVCDRDVIYIIAIFLMPEFTEVLLVHVISPKVGQTTPIYNLRILAVIPCGIWISFCGYLPAWIGICRVKKTCSNHYYSTGIAT